MRQLRNRNHNRHFFLRRDSLLRGNRVIVLGCGLWELPYGTTAKMTTTIWRPA